MSVAESLTLKLHSPPTTDLQNGLGEPPHGEMQREAEQIPQNSIIATVSSTGEGHPGWRVH